MNRIKGKSHTIILIGTEKYIYKIQHFNKLEIEEKEAQLEKGIGLNAKDRFLRSGARQRCQLLSPPFNMVLEILTSAVSRGKKEGKGKESVFADVMNLYIDKSQGIHAHINSLN